MSLRVARRLDRAQISSRVVDMRWLAPLPIQDIVREANATGRVLVVDETRSSGGVAKGVVTALVDEGFTGPRARVASEDSFIPSATPHWKCCCPKTSSRPPRSNSPR